MSAERKQLLLREVTLENFGIFRGLQRFDLTTGNLGSHRNVILFGGKNGTGKTTILEGIKLCLYGPSCLGRRLSDSQYAKYLQNKVHKYSGLSISESSSVSIEFDHVQMGKASRYSVRRSWSSIGSDQNLSILRDGKPMGEVSSVQLQDFLLELIPIGLSRLFFFDGEQIQNLAEDEPNNEHISDAFKALLGLDVVEHLRADLKIHLARQRHEGEESAKRTLQTLQEENARLRKERDTLWIARAKKQTEIDTSDSEIERAERLLASQGGGYVANRDSLRMEKRRLETVIMQFEEEIKDLASSYLPFAVVPVLCMNLKSRILMEEKLREAATADMKYRETISRIRDELGNGRLWEDAEVAEGQRRIISNRIIQIMESMVESHESRPRLVHQLSPKEREKILEWIDHCSTQFPIEFRGKTANLENAMLALRTVEEHLSRAPPDEAISPIIQRLNKAHQERGRLDVDMKNLEDSLKQVESRLKGNERDIAGQFEHLKLAASIKRRAELVVRTGNALREFAESLKRRRLEELTEIFVYWFNSLSQKKSLIDRIEIEPETFSIRLHRQNGTLISKDAMSAGEKQIFAVAMLVTLAKVSRRPLPFVIDTPLARLDAEHRGNIVSNFIPKVSHQVIVLSTDTEIDRAYFTRLTPSIARTYTLKYDEAHECTAASPGYFWKQDAEEVVS